MKKIIALSSVVALATVGFASTNIETRLDTMENKITKLEKKLKKANKKLNKVKAHDAGDNIKWDVNFRTSLDSISYTMADGTKRENDDLLTNRLWLGMAFAPDTNTIFKGKLSYLKAYGDTANHSQSNSAMGVGFADFDWVTNENAVSNEVKVKEAYWLYMNPTFLGSDIPWTASIGRRPSTDGLGINFRENMKDNSPLSHTVNVEFDGASAKFTLDKVTPLKGGWFKFCTGRGMTNALPRFNMDVNGADYAEDDTKTEDIDMYGFIFVPFDNGQYSLHTNWANATNLIGFTESSMMNFQYAGMGIDPTTLDMTSPSTNYIGMTTKQLDGTTNVMADATTQNKTSGTTTAMVPSARMAYAPEFQNFGDMELLTAMFKAEGLGDGINDFLDETIFFASFAQSKTKPVGDMKMLGSNDSETGNSTWIGLNMPSPFSDEGRFGVEWNKGSKFWRSVTYGEDTMIGSKISARGTALEVYYNQPMTKALNFNAKLLSIDYDYTGSNMFFGEDGKPRTIAQAKAMGQNPVEKASSLTLSVSYIF